MHEKLINYFGEFGKLRPERKKCIFIRYSEHSKGYVFIEELERMEIILKLYHEMPDFPKKDEIGEGEPLYEMLNSKDQVMSSSILDNSMDQEMISGLSGSYESKNPMKKSKL